MEMEITSCSMRPALEPRAAVYIRGSPSGCPGVFAARKLRWAVVAPDICGGHDVPRLARRRTAYCRGTRVSRWIAGNPGSKEMGCAPAVRDQRGKYSDQYYIYACPYSRTSAGLGRRNISAVSGIWALSRSLCRHDPADPAALLLQSRLFLVFRLSVVPRRCEDEQMCRFQRRPVIHESVRSESRTITLRVVAPYAFANRTSQRRLHDEENAPAMIPPLTLRFSAGCQ